MKLNLGSGNKLLSGYVNVDIENHKQQAELEGKHFIQFDLEKPFPITDNIITEIRCTHVIEHLFNLSQFVDELYRISYDGCKIFITVPHFTSPDFEFHIRKCRYDLLKDYCKIGEKYTNGKYYVNSYLQKSYFKNVKRTLKFDSVYSFGNVLNKNPKWCRWYETTFLRNIFFCKEIILECEISKT